MARIDSLTNFLTDIATAIKTKKGDDTPILASNFDTEITNLPSGATAPEVGFVVDEYDTSGYATEVSVYGLTTLPSYSFGGYGETSNNLLNRKLTTLNLPDELHTFNDNCCKYATKLNMSQLPQSTRYIGSYSFQYCDNSNLNIIDFSNISSTKIIKSYAFGNNKLTNLRIINQSNLVLSLEQYAFTANSNLTELVLDGYIALNQASYCFRNNTSLKKATIKPFRVAYILGDNFFNGCSVLDTLIIETDSLVMAQPDSSTFTNTPIANGTGSIYVTDSMVESYKAKWTNYATLIKPLSELPE